MALLIQLMLLTSHGPVWTADDQRMRMVHHVLQQRQVAVERVHYVLYDIS